VRRSGAVAQAKDTFVTFLVMRYSLLQLNGLILIPVLTLTLLAGCGSGSGGSDGGETPPGPVSGGGDDGTGSGGGGGSDSGSSSTSSSPPKLLSVSPENGATAVAVTAAIEMTFDKSMDSASFAGGFEVTPREPGFSDFTFSCVEGTQCKTIRAVPGGFFEYGETYTVALRDDIAAPRDVDGLKLGHYDPWSFTTVDTFDPDLGFQRLTIDGGDINGKNAGECTAIGVDSKGTVHVTYLSVSDWAVKRAYCPSGRDCSLRQNWEIEVIDGNSSAPNAPFTPAHGIGRDENMTIETVGPNDFLHLAYRDYGGNSVGSTNDGHNVLRYATNRSGGWQAITIDDATDAITDTYIKVGTNGRIHISYRRGNRDNSNAVVTSLAYATCNAADCATNLASWTVIDIEGGSAFGNNDFGTPNHIFVTSGAVHISYHANQTLKYATCVLNSTDACKSASDWTKIVVDDSADVGTDSSLSVMANVVHITYRDNTHGDLKYARCVSDCTNTDNWQKTAIDTVGDVGAISQIKIGSNGRLHVSYRDRGNADLKYATCPSNCIDPASWSLYRIDAPGRVGWDTYIALGPTRDSNGVVIDPEGMVHISYRDSGNEALKYAWGAAPN
jgi:hypothetical protein